KLHTFTFSNKYSVTPDIVVSPNKGTGASGTYTSISGTGFLNGSTITANSITIGGKPTIHSAINIPDNGTFSATIVTLNKDLGEGTHDVVVNDGKEHIFRNYYTKDTTLGNKERPSIYLDGSTLYYTWEDDRSGQKDVYVKVGTAEYLVNDKDVAAQGSPDIGKTGSNIVIVWTDYRDGNAEIYLKDITTVGNNIRITNEGSHQLDPAIYGEYVVWTDYRNGGANPDIYMCYIDSGSDWSSVKKETQITTDPSSQCAPDIWG
ncbi:MAG: hypothetical protein QME40_08100, partial [bacterium]|nr:hypothetical protein [bacterium]